MDETTGEKVCRLRKAKGWSQRELSRRSGLSLGAARLVEEGLRPDPQMSTLVALAAALDVPLNELLGDSAPARKAG